MNVPVAILAGGLATRLGPLTQRTPKSLLDVAGKPFILHQIELLRRNHLCHIVICLGHLGHQVQEALGAGAELGIRLEYSFDGPVLRGTGGALQHALPLLGESFFVLYGDSYLDVDYLAIHAAFERSGKTGLMTVFHNRGRWDRSNVVFRNGQVISYDKRNPHPTAEYIDYGLGLLRREAFTHLAPEPALDLADVYRYLVTAGQLAGFEVFRRFYEIGSVEGLEETRARLSGKV